MGEGSLAGVQENMNNNNQIPAKRRRGSANSTGVELEPYEEQATAYLLRQVAERLANSLTQSLRPFKQSTSVYRVLIALTRSNPATMRELIELTLIEPSTLSRSVARMAELELVVCSPVEGDARALSITITDKGRDMLVAIRPAATAQFDWAVHNIPAEELAAMRLTLKKMLLNLKISPIK